MEPACSGERGFPARIGPSGRLQDDDTISCDDATYLSRDRQTDIRSACGGLDVDDDDLAASEHEQIASTDPRWQWWSTYVLEAMLRGISRASKLLDLRPGGVGPSRVRQCLAWLELNGMALYCIRLGWRCTEYGKKLVADRQSNGSGGVALKSAVQNESTRSVADDGPHAEFKD